MTTLQIRTLLEGATRIAVVGASTNPEKPAHRIPLQLIDAGFDVIPVHPSAEEVFGRPAVPTLGDVDGHVDIVDVFRPAEEAAEIARQAVAIGAGALWLQLGITSSEARSIAEAGGLDVIEDRCIGATVRELGIKAA